MNIGQFNSRIQSLAVATMALECKSAGHKRLYEAACVSNDQNEMEKQRQTVLSLTEQVLDNMALTQMLLRQMINEAGDEL